MRANWIQRILAVVVLGVLGAAVSGVSAGPPIVVEPRPMLVIGPDPMIVVGPGGAPMNYELRANTPGQWIEIFVSSFGEVPG